MSPVIRQFSCILNELGKYNSIKHSISLKNEKKKIFLTKGISTKGTVEFKLGKPQLHSCISNYSSPTELVIAL